MNFILFVEIADAFTADISNVNLVPMPQPYKKFDTGGYQYAFTQDNIPYIIKFQITKFKDNFEFAKSGIDVTNLQCYEISMEGPNFYEPTYNNPNPTPIYTELIKAIRKFIQIANPPILKIAGFSPIQSRIYLRIYTMFLRYYYTRLTGILSPYYVRKDILIPKNEKMPLRNVRREIKKSKNNK